MEPFLVGAEGLEPNGSNTGETALSENGGHPGGHFGEDSDSVASIRGQLLDELQRALATFGRLDLAAESAIERKRLATLQSRLSKLMKELAADDET